MIICSCAVVSDSDLEAALVEILSLPEAPLPTPGVVFRHLEKKMVCCGCAPLAVATIYEKIDLLAKKGLACPYTCAHRPDPARQDGGALARSAPPPGATGPAPWWRRRPAAAGQCHPRARLKLLYSTFDDALKVLARRPHLA